MIIATGTKLGLYEIRSKIGEGGRGEVYGSYGAKMNREPAIKALLNGLKSFALKSVVAVVLVTTALPSEAAKGAERTTIQPKEFPGIQFVPELLGDSQPRSGNPIIPGWYADPEAHIFNHEYWIYPTYSARYDDQVFFDAFSSKDLISWEKHSRIFANVDAPWVKRALWAPSVVEKGGWYYLFFGANDIQNDQQLGGIGVARSRRPGGPFKDYLGKPLIDKFHNGAQPIDQFVFKDPSGSYYIIYGGWRHCNIAKLNDDFTGLVPLADGTTFKEITPKGYVEGAFMFVKDGKYYFMWSEGGWTGPDYAVAYAVGSSVFGPFERVGKILQQDPSVATGAGHHSVLHRPGSSRWYIVYHRRPLGETDRNHRVVCIDEMYFDEQGLIQSVVITKEGVPRDLLRLYPQ